MGKTRVTARAIFMEIFEWSTRLKGEGIAAQRIHNLHKPLSAYDEKELLGHALGLMGYVRDRLVDGKRVGEVYADFCIARTILSFCSRIPAGELSTYQ